MMLSTRNQSDGFFTKRLIRIIPTYYLFTIGLLLVAFLIPSITADASNEINPRNPVILIKSLLFIPFDKLPILFMGWTLNYEMMFYALFAIALKINPVNRGVLASFFVLSLLLVSGFSEGPPFKAYANNIMMEFILGILLFELLSGRKKLNIAILVSIYFLPLFLVDFDLSSRGCSYGLTAFFVCGLVLVSSNMYQIPRWFVFAGATSYTLYLTHVYVIWFVYNMTDRLDMPGYMAFVAPLTSIIAAIAVGSVIYISVEKPIQHYLRSKVSGRKR